MAAQKRIRAALYARVSTTDQNAQLQLDELRTVAEHRGWTVVGEFIDHGVSGAKDKRPELDRLKAEAVRGKLDIVACWKFDRFARSVKHLVLALADFQAVGVDFISLKDNVDTSTPVGKLSFHVLAALAEFERDVIRERTKAGVAAARKRGALLGRPRRDVDVGRVVALKAQGRSLREISKELGIGAATLLRRLRTA